MMPTTTPEAIQSLANKTNEIRNVLLAFADSVRNGDLSVDDLQSAYESLLALRSLAQQAGVPGYGQIVRFATDLIEGIASGQLAAGQVSGDALFQLVACLQEYGESLPAPLEREQALLTRAVLIQRRLLHEPVSGDAKEIEAYLHDLASQKAPPSESVPPELLEVFQQEAEDHFRNIHDSLALLRRNASDTAALQSIRRSLHTLKGASGSVGLRVVSALAHRAEDLIDRLNEGEIPSSPDLAGLLYDATDLLQDLSAAERSHSEFDARLDLVYARFDALLSNDPAVPAPTKAPAVAEPAPVPAKTEGFVRVRLDRIDDLVGLAGELMTTRSVFELHLSAYRREMEEMERILSRFRTVIRRHEEAQLVSHPSLTIRAQEFDDLEFDRYGSLHTLLRDLNEVASDVDSATSELSSRYREFDSYLLRMSRLTREVQNKLIRTRMVKFRSIGQRLERTIRVASEACGKPAELVLEDNSVELDRTVLQDVAGAIEHLLRNAVYHGVEPAAERQARGKSVTGKLTVRSFYEGIHVVIEVADDGGGLQLPAIREAMITSGHYTKEAVDRLSDAELQNVIFQPGFSTAQQIDEVAGRGVGLDAVRGTVLDLHGSISVQSTPGNGVVFRVQVPTSLALMRVVLVRANEETFAVPLSDVVRMGKPESVQALDGGLFTIQSEGETMRAATLTSLFGSDPASSESVRAVILKAKDQKVGLLVDRILETREAVVRGLSSVIGPVPSILGCTLLGDGTPTLILNPAELARMALATQPAAPERIPAVITETPSSKDILIVDDSLSIRRVVSYSIRKANWNPLVAKDGLEALDVLQSAPKLPDVILLDIEMPGMDGYEFLANLKEHDTYKKIPVVMMTSRSGDKHRAKALALGAADYLTKPCPEEDLLVSLRTQLG